MNKEEAHLAQQRNFKRVLDSAAENTNWFKIGGDGRLEEAQELWYEKYPGMDIRESLVAEPDICPDLACLRCYPNTKDWVD